LFLFLLTKNKNATARALLGLGFVTCALLHHCGPESAEFVLYQLIPFAVLVDIIVTIIQAIGTVDFINYLGPFDKVMLYEKIYAELLPVLGYDFLGQFSQTNLIKFYFKCLELLLVLLQLQA
jgi:hypothetical protein